MAPLEMETANAYYGMAQAADGVGVTLLLEGSESGFRAMGEQQYFYDCYVSGKCNKGNPAACPGTSKHQSGVALDFFLTEAPYSGPFFSDDTPCGKYSGSSAPTADVLALWDAACAATSPEFAWLKEHGNAHGFERTYWKEPWHWVYKPTSFPPAAFVPLCNEGGCTPHCEGTVTIDANCQPGDCGVFGLTCVMNKGIPECKAGGCTPHCQGTVAVGADCSEGDCGAFGAGCKVIDGKATCVNSDCVNAPAGVFCEAGKAYECTPDGAKTEVPPPLEVCDGEDNDCDGQIDEGVKNACGACGPVQPESCDGMDNDCDGQIDEGVKNACGTCGLVPVELCDGKDNDCDGQIDEGVTNTCGTCGPVQPEFCDGMDNDCDGSIDEGVTNACGGCGPVPVEICDGMDNDCDGTSDEGVTNACGGCGPVPVEICDGMDNDCDGTIDEGVTNACGGCGPVPAELCDDQDNDCDGTIDNGFNVGAPCSVNLGDCEVQGTTLCAANGTSVLCQSLTDTCPANPEPEPDPDPDPEPEPDPDPEPEPDPDPDPDPEPEPDPDPDPDPDPEPDPDPGSTADPVSNADAGSATEPVILSDPNLGRPPPTSPKAGGGGCALSSGAAPSTSGILFGFLVLLGLATRRRLRA